MPFGWPSLISLEYGCTQGVGRSWKISYSKVSGVADFRWFLCFTMTCTHPSLVGNTSRLTPQKTNKQSVLRCESWGAQMHQWNTKRRGSERSSTKEQKHVIIQYIYIYIQYIYIYMEKRSPAQVTGWCFFPTKSWFSVEMLSVFFALRRTRRAVRQESYTFAFSWCHCVAWSPLAMQAYAVSNLQGLGGFVFYLQTNRWDMSNGFHADDSWFFFCSGSLY